MRSVGFVRAALREIRPTTILTAALLWLLVYAFPGIMTMDSFDHLREGREWYFTDAHPPAMAALFGIVDRIVPGPPGMLVLQGTAFLLGLYLVFRRVMAPRAAALAAALVFVFPPVFTPFAVIWKDCIMAGALVLGIGAVLDERLRIRVLGLLAFVVATAMRYNALAATFPLVVLLFEWQPGMRPVKRYALAVATWLAITALALGANAVLTDKKLHIWHASLALQDIVGVLAFVDTDVPDDTLKQLLAPTEIRANENLHATLRSAYRSDDLQHLVSGDGRLWDVTWTEPLPVARRDAISHAWRTLLGAYPGAYISYRLEMFGEMLGVNQRYRGAMVVPHRAQYPGMLDYMSVGRAQTAFQRRVQNMYLSLARGTRLFRPHVYVLLALGLLLLCRRERLAGALLLSGIAMEGTLLVLGGTPDYRYSHWLVIVTCIALVTLFVRRRARPA